VTKARDRSNNAYCFVNFVKTDSYKPNFQCDRRIFESDLAVKNVTFSVSLKISWQPSRAEFYKCDNFIVKHLLYLI